LGGGAVMRNKLPAVEQIGIDLDPAVLNIWRQRWPKLCDLVPGDAVDYLQSIQLDSDTVIYSDPPYHPDTRRRERVYRCDYSIRDHERLLECLVALPCKIMISGYASPLYEKHLAGWSVHRFQAKTRVDIREEWVWFNYAKPEVLHDNRHLGKNYREREVIRRRQERLRSRICRLSMAEQMSLYGWLEEKHKAENCL
jgi:site-specific DNA-adenine methylase